MKNRIENKLKNLFFETVYPNIVNLFINNRDNISSNAKVEYLKFLIEYQKDQHQGLLSSITEIRSVSNYAITGVIAFSGFLLTSNILNQNNFQKFILFTLLLFILILWTNLNLSKAVSVGFDPIAGTKLLDSLNKHQDPEIKQDPAKHLYEATLKALKNEYFNLQKVCRKITRLKTALLICSLVYFIIAILFLNFTDFRITISF